MFDDEEFSKGHRVRKEETWTRQETYLFLQLNVIVKYALLHRSHASLPDSWLMNPPSLLELSYIAFLLAAEINRLIPIGARTKHTNPLYTPNSPDSQT